MEELTFEERTQVNVARSGFYGFLASIYKLELTEDQIEDLAHSTFPLEDEYVGGGYTLIKEYLRHRDRGTRQQLAVDYAHVFLCAGMYEQLMAPPYESVYTSKDHLLMQEARDGALAFYRGEGLDLPPENTTPEDHISFEFQFMAKLVERTQSADEAGDTAAYGRLIGKQRAFFDEHLDDWLPRFCKDVRAYAQTDFYRGIADITEGFMRLEDEMIAQLACVA